MATVKYATASPYVERPPLHPSDHRQTDYEARLLGPEAGRGKPEIKRVGLVLFGTGRQVRRRSFSYLLVENLGICSSW